MTGIFSRLIQQQKVLTLTHDLHVGEGEGEFILLALRLSIFSCSPAQYTIPFLLLVNLLIIFTINCFVSKMSKCLQIAPFDQTLHLLAQMTKKSSKSFHFRSWNQQVLKRNDRRLIDYQNRWQIILF